MAETRPRAFVSYRHAESPDRAGNAGHRAWVGAFVDGLAARGVRAIWDQDIRAALARHAAIDANELPLCAEISRAFTLLGNAFIPIVTPAYLERLGVEHGRRVASLRYGVVFEEWQGAAALILQGRVRGVPVIRRGQPSQLNMNDMLSVMGMPATYDLRGDDPARFAAELDRIAAAVTAARDLGNEGALIEPDALCDLYIAWARAEMADRAHAPVDTWWFHTGAANEFIGYVGALMAGGDGRDPNEALRAQAARLSALADAAPRTVTADALIGFTGAALAAVSDDLGWAHAEAALRFAEGALHDGMAQGAPRDLARVRANLGAGWLRVSARGGDGGALGRAEDHARAALAALAGAEALDLAKAHSTFAAILAAKARGGNSAARAEAKTQWRQVKALAGRLNDSETRKAWRAKARAGLRDLR
jgi:hypothetical protein